MSATQCRRSDPLLEDHRETLRPRASRRAGPRDVKEVGKLPVEFNVAFPYGVFMVGEITPVRDYDKPTPDRVVQAKDPESDLPVWAVDVVDPDPEASKKNHTMTIKVAAKVQPVLDKIPEGQPFRAVEFQGLTATAYIEDNGNFSRVAWSMRAAAVSDAGTKPANRSNDKAA